MTGDADVPSLGEITLTALKHKIIMKFRFENGSLPAHAQQADEYADDLNIQIPQGTKGSTNGEGGCVAEMWVWQCDLQDGWVAGRRKGSSI